MQSNEPLELFETKPYIDKQGTEVWECKSLNDPKDIKYLGMLTIPTPFGMQEMKAVIKEAKNLADAFIKFYDMRTKLENNIEEELRKESKPKVVISNQMPPEPKLLVA